jgi:zinc/manganese transport system permease protein
MSELLQLMAAPFGACVVLVGIHAYLGMHVIQRKVIFVDLALAQIAALGATFGFLLGISPHGRGAYVFSLGFAIAGAAIFSLTRMRHERVPQEAIIGIVYAGALALAILVADRAPQGAEHIKETLVGSILWVTWPTVLKTAGIYALVGALHIALRKRFLQISFRPEQAFAEGRWVRLWDFIFYVTFAFVITSSVAIAGVLLVFSFLVIPAVIATLFAARISVRLAVGWTVGIAACLIGLVASYRFDMPSGPTVVTSLAVALSLAGLLYSIRMAPSRRSALIKASAGSLLVVGILGGFAVLLTQGALLQIEHEHEWEADAPVPPGAPPEGHERWHALLEECRDDAACLAGRLGQRPDWLEIVPHHLISTDPGERELVIDVLGLLDHPEGYELLATTGADEADDLLCQKIARLLAEGGDHRGLRLAVDLLDAGHPPLVRDEAHQLLLEQTGQEFGYDPFADGEANAAAIARWRAWLQQSRDPDGTGFDG